MGTKSIAHFRFLVFIFMYDEIALLWLLGM